MKVTLISKEANEFKFEVAYTFEEFDAAVEKVYKKERANILIDGFRKGKAPRKIIESRYGADIFYSDALNNLFDTGYVDALNELDIDPIEQPRLGVGDINKGEDVVITVEVKGFPEVEIANYKGLEVVKSETVITDEDVEAALAEEQRKQVRQESITDRPSQEGDIVIIDFVGTVNGEAFEGGSAENFQLKLGSGQFIPGFEEQLIGKNAEEVVDVEVVFPDEYHAEELAGRPAVFKTTIHEIKAELLPEIDDEFASDVSEFETLDEYKADIKAKLQQQADVDDENNMKESALKALYEANEVEAPASMVENEIERVIADMQTQFSYQGIQLNDYLTWTGQTMENLREEAKITAERRVKTRILLKNIVRMEGIEATEEEYEEALAQYAGQYGADVDNIKAMLGEGDDKYFKEDVQTQKAIELIYQAAVIVDAPAETEAE